MLRAVREWWGSARWQRPLRLFAFEFLVVMAGVLAAQTLQNWVAGRSDRERGAALVAAARGNGQSLGATMNFWTAYGPCMRAHVRRIAAVASEGGTLSQQQIGRPALPVVPLTSWTEEGRRLASLAVPDGSIAGLVSFNAVAANVSDIEADISREWATLRLIDPALGAPLESDRSRVRQAAAVIDNRIGFLIYGKSQVMRLADQLELEMPDSATANVLSQVNRCGLLDKWQ